MILLYEHRSNESMKSIIFLKLLKLINDTCYCYCQGKQVHIIITSYIHYFI
jgi:hypothetical protein